MVFLSYCYYRDIVHSPIVFVQQGNLFRKVHADETMWTIEDDGTLLNIVLAKADFIKKEIVWESLMEDGSFRADPIIYHEMRKKLDLEKFQIEVCKVKYNYKLKTLYTYQIKNYYLNSFLNII